MPRALRPVSVAVALVMVALALDVQAAVLCAKRRKDGTLSTRVKVREACRPFQEQVLPQDVGISCSAATTTTTSTIDPSQCPTTSTLGAPPCSPGPGVCFMGQDCVQTSPGFFECVGPARCGEGFTHYCGGECPLAQGCDERPVPAGCGPIGCGCQPLHPDRPTTTTSSILTTSTTSTSVTTTTSSSITTTSSTLPPCGSAAAPACFGECEVAGTHCVYNASSETCGCIFTTTTTT